MQEEHHEGKKKAQEDVRKILAEYFNVPEERVIDSKYSYIIIEKEEKESEDSSE